MNIKHTFSGEKCVDTCNKKKLVRRKTFEISNIKANS